MHNAQVNWTDVPLHKGIGRMPSLKTDLPAHLMCTNTQLDVGQDFRSLIPRNSFFRWVVVVSWIFGVCLFQSILHLVWGLWGLERGSLHEVFTLLTLFFYLFIFCFHAIMQVQDQKKRKSFSQQSSKTEITDLKLKSIKTVRNLPNLTEKITFLVLYVDTTEQKNHHNRVNNLELFWRALWRRSHSGKLHFHNVYMYSNHIWCEEIFPNTGS